MVHPLELDAQDSLAIVGAMIAQRQAAMQRRVFARSDGRSAAPSFAEEGDYDVWAVPGMKLVPQELLMFFRAMHGKLRVGKDSTRARPKLLLQRAPIGCKSSTSQPVARSR